MRWKVPSSNTGSDDNASAAAERDSGVLAGLTAACGGFAATGGLAATEGFSATAGLGGVPTPCASAEPAASATMTPAIEMVRINPPPQPGYPIGMAGFRPIAVSVAWATRSVRSHSIIWLRRSIRRAATDGFGRVPKPSANTEADAAAGIGALRSSTIPGSASSPSLDETVSPLSFILVIDVDGRRLQQKQVVGHGDLKLGRAVTGAGGAVDDGFQSHRRGLVGNKADRRAVDYQHVVRYECGGDIGIDGGVIGRNVINLDGNKRPLKVKARLIFLRGENAIGADEARLRGDLRGGRGEHHVRRAAPAGYGEISFKQSGQRISRRLKADCKGEHWRRLPLRDRYCRVRARSAVGARHSLRGSKPVTPEELLLQFCDKNSGGVGVLP